MSLFNKIINDGNSFTVHDIRIPDLSSSQIGSPLVVGEDGAIGVSPIASVVNSWNGQTGNVIYNPPVLSVNGQTGHVVVDGTNYTVTITESVPTGLLKRYTFTQCGNIIGTVDLAKDLVVTSGEVVTNPLGQAPGKYIKLIIANQETPLYINVNDLVKVYTAEPNASYVQLAISNTNEISATIVDGSLAFEKADATFQKRITDNEAAISNALTIAREKQSPATTLAGYGITDAATSDSPELAGIPTAPTALSITDTDQIATTAFVHSITDNLTTDVWHASTTAPTDTKLLWIDTHTDGTGGLKYYNGSTWVTVPVHYT